MAKAVTPDPVIGSFTEYQNNHITQDGIIPKWFHGNISRKQAEEMLMTKPPGCFLIRVSESRIGYTLSYRAEHLCRHFMIDMLPENRCEIVGEKQRHDSLHDLVAFHCRNPIDHFPELLTVACEQAGQNTSADTPPAQPACQASHPLISNKNSSISSGISVSTPRLYPNLEQEFNTLSLGSTESSINPPPQPKLKLNHKPLNIALRWPSDHSKTSTADEKSTGLQTASNQRKSTDKTAANSQVEFKPNRISLIHYKNIFKKKKIHHSEEHTHLDFNEAKVKAEPAAVQIVANTDHKEADGVSGALPMEYRNPPPFAPGY